MESIDDIAKLMELGLVSKDNAYTLSNMLLNADLNICNGTNADAGAFAKMFVTPKNKNDSILAEATVHKMKSEGTNGSV